MTFIGNLIDPSAKPAQDFGPIPSGEYVAIIVDSDMKPTKNNNGQYLELTYQIADGALKGRLVWCRLNLDNPNAQAVAIAQQHLAAIRVACGLQQVTDSAQLHNLPHVIRVEFVPADGVKRQKDSNEVKGWKRIEGVPTPSASAPSPFAAQKPTAAACAPAWAGLWREGIHSRRGETQ